MGTWQPFWFEGNLAWGMIESPKDWEQVKTAYKGSMVDFRKAQRCETVDHPYFGFASECNGKETLGEFADKHGISL